MSKKRKIAIFVVACLLVITLFIAGSYALWVIRYEQDTTNTVDTKCFSINYSATSGISQTNTYPMTDEEGLLTTPYEVTITNNCNYPVTYDVVLNQIGSSSLTSYIKYQLDDKIAKVNSNPTVTPTISNATKAYKISGGVLGGNSSRTLSLKTWIDSSLTSQLNSFNFKITIETIAGTTNSSYLAAKILSNNKLNTTSPNFNVAPTDETSGLYQMEDDEGMSYYFRGNIDNNYISFAGKLWRIVRINGDGSIRIITEDSVGNSAFNTTHQGYQYVGYTYNNSHNCTNTNPCNGTEGTASTMKTYLDNWYNTNLKSYEDKIATSDYCNDTSYTISGSARNYGADDRLIGNHNQTLNCPNTTVNYGGKYNLKVGLLSADEIALAGIESGTSNQTGENYLYKSDWWWSFSPNSSSAHSAGVFSAGSNLRYSYTYASRGVHPVISLKANTKIISGDGTESNPYVVD